MASISLCRPSFFMVSFKAVSNAVGKMDKNCRSDFCLGRIFLIKSKKYHLLRSFSKKNPWKIFDVFPLISKLVLMTVRTIHMRQSILNMPLFFFTENSRRRIYKFHAEQVVSIEIFWTQKLLLITQFPYARRELFIFGKLKAEWSLKFSKNTLNLN